MHYKVDILNNNIPLYAVISENSQILLRTKDKNFAKEICFLLNNKKIIFESLKFLDKEMKGNLYSQKVCKICEPKEECGCCRYKPFIKSFKI